MKRSVKRSCDLIFYPALAIFLAPKHGGRGWGAEPPKFLFGGPLLRHLLLIQMHFCKDYDYGEKANLSKGYWNPKRKMWVTTHFQG